MENTTKSKTLIEYLESDGAVRIGVRSWAIPKGTEKPNDARIKSGKYIRGKDK